MSLSFIVLTSILVATYLHINLSYLSEVSLTFHACFRMDVAPDFIVNIFSIEVFTGGFKNIHKGFIEK